MERRSEMSRALFKTTIKNNWILWLIFTLVSLGYLLMIVSMYSDDFVDYIGNALKAVPEGLASAVGMDTIPMNVTDFVANYYYGFLTHLFLTAHVILLGLRLVVKEVDNGSMAYLLSTPSSRFSVIVTKYLYMVLSLLAMIAIMTLLAIAAAGTPLDVWRFVQLNFTTWLVAVAMASIVFLFSSVMNNTSMAAASGGGILILFFIFTLIDSYGHSEGFYGVIGNFSIFSLLRAREIVSGEVNLWINNFLLLFIALGSAGTGMLIFIKRDLPL